VGQGLKTKWKQQ